MGNWFGPSTRIKLYVRELRNGRTYSININDPNDVSDIYEVEDFLCIYLSSLISHVSSLLRRSLIKFPKGSQTFQEMK